MSRMYSVAYRFGMTPWEDAGSGSGFRKHLAEILDRVSVPQNGVQRALDMGCGTGDHSIELAARGWQVTGVDAVEKAIEQARLKAQSAQVNTWFVSGDVTNLPESIGRDYGLVLDVGCFHGLSGTARIAYAREVTAVAVRGASLLMFAFSPGRRGPLPRGVGPREIEQTFTGWRTTAHEIANTEGLAAPIRRMSPWWFQLNAPVTSHAELARRLTSFIVRNLGSSKEHGVVGPKRSWALVNPAKPVRLVVGPT